MQREMHPERNQQEATGGEKQVAVRKQKLPASEGGDVTTHHLRGGLSDTRQPLNPGGGLSDTRQPLNPGGGFLCHDQGEYAVPMFPDTREIQCYGGVASPLICV